MTSETRVVDLTVEDLQELVREAVRDALGELVLEADPDAGLHLRADVAEYLRDFLRREPYGTPLGDVVRDIGLNDG